MQQIKISAICAAMVLFFSTTTVISRCAASNKMQLPEGSGFAVLELFTSEGCSSCPPADELLARIQEEAGDKPVYLLSYHVDYWNRLGWKDGFSNSTFSNRQYEYSQRLNEQVYTPQLIINGQAACVGSNEEDVRSGISAALQKHPPVVLNITGKQQADQLQVNYEAGGMIGHSELVLAIVQKHAISQVKSGENEGRTLSHAQIVNSLYKLSLDKTSKGVTQVRIPPAFNTKDWEAIAMVQEKQTGKITAVSRIAIDPLL